MRSVGLCKVCLSEDTREAFAADSYQIYRCKRCSHLGVIGSISQSILEASYGRDYYGGVSTRSGQLGAKGYEDYLGSAETRIKGYSWRMEKIGRFFPTPGRLLDYGCAVGFFVKVAKDAGWIAKGLERSRWAANYGRDVLGLDIEIGDGRLNPFEPECFDVVTLWDVLEHIEYPREVIALVKQWLRPGGLLFLNTVDSSSLGARLAGRQWRHIAPPLHLQYFTRRSLTVLLCQSGFEIVNLVGNGVVLAGRQGNPPLAKPLQHLEKLMTHWRVRPIATALHLLDEIDIVATMAKFSR